MHACVRVFERLYIFLKFYSELAGPHSFKLFDMTWNDNITSSGLV